VTSRPEKKQNQKYVGVTPSQTSYQGTAAVAFSMASCPS